MARRILLLVTDLQIGGTPTVVRELATRLHRPAAGVHVEVACLAAWGPVADQIRDTGVTVTAFGATRAWQLPGVVRRLRRLVRDHAIDTVFSFLLHANSVAGIAAVGLGRVRFIQSIQTTQREPRWHWLVQRVVQRAAERVVVPSASVADVARDWSSIPTEKLVVIPNAIEPDAFPRSPVPEQDRRPYPIGFIGRLDPVKRVGPLIIQLGFLNELAAGLVHLHVFGDGPEAESLREVARKAGRDGLVTFHGAVAKPQDALLQIGLLVLPSEAEGFGLVLIEAMAAGVPVVATNVAGIRDVVRHGETGLLASSDCGDLALVIRQVILDEGLRRRLIRGGLAEVRSRFSWENILTDYRRLLGLSCD